MNIPSSPRFYAIISSVLKEQATQPLFHNIASRNSTAAMSSSSASSYESVLPHLSPILSANTGSPSRWHSEHLPAPRSIGQTPPPENNHWLNVGDRFVFLGGDSEDFKAYVVEATHRAALVPFEARATYRSASTVDSAVTEYWMPYVEPARVFINPGKPWFKTLALFDSMSQAHELGVPQRKWLFLDGRDEDTREVPTDFGAKKAKEFVQTVLETYSDNSTEWEVDWEMMVGTAETFGSREGWSWRDDLRGGFTWQDAMFPVRAGDTSPLHSATCLYPIVSVM